MSQKSKKPVFNISSAPTVTDDVLYRVVEDNGIPTFDLVTGEATVDAAVITPASSSVSAYSAKALSKSGVSTDDEVRDFLGDATVGKRVIRFPSMLVEKVAVIKSLTRNPKRSAPAALTEETRKVIADAAQVGIVSRKGSAGPDWGEQQQIFAAISEDFTYVN